MWNIRGVDNISVPYQRCVDIKRREEIVFSDFFVYFRHIELLTSTLNLLWNQ